MAKKDKKPKQKKGTKIVVMMILLSLTLIFTIKTSFIFLIMGILPSIVAYYVDISKSRSTFHTVFACNLSGVLPFLIPMIIEGNRKNAMIEQLDLQNFLVIYASAAVGYALVHSSPHLAAFVISTLNQRHIARLNAAQNKLVQEWGPDIRISTNA